jgi:hypothetical protein
MLTRLRRTVRLPIRGRHDAGNGSEIISIPSAGFREETSAVRPRKQPLKPVIGELENRTEYGSYDL